MAPPHTMVPELMDNLFNWMNEVKDTINPLILSSIFHYEFVFIHPFHDGNGRTARLWQTVILSHWEKAFAYLPIESMIKKNQEEYYKAIQNCNNAGNLFTIPENSQPYCYYGCEISRNDEVCS